MGKDGKPVTELKTEFGTIVLMYEQNADGTVTTHYKYTLDNESADLDAALKAAQEAGKLLNDSAKVVAVDTHGAVSEGRDITITMNLLTRIRAVRNPEKALLSMTATVI